MKRHLVAALLAGAAFAFPAVAEPVVSGAWMRALPGNLPAGGYFTLANPDTKPLQLTGAQSPACGTLMLHMTHNMGGMTHMMAVESVEVPARGKVEFKPGGYHLMCTEPKGLKPGTSVPVTLQFAGGARVTAPFAVKDASGN